MQIRWPICLAIIFAVLFIFMVCVLSSDPTPVVCPSHIQSAEGVFLQGFGYDSGTLENTNSYSVRVRRVLQFQGEQTESIDRMAPGEKLFIPTLSHQHGFYIYTLDGVMVGWLSRKCPEK